MDREKSVRAWFAILRAFSAKSSLVEIKSTSKFVIYTYMRWHSVCAGHSHEQQTLQVQFKRDI